MQEGTIEKLQWNQEPTTQQTEMHWSYVYRNNRNWGKIKQEKDF